MLLWWLLLSCLVPMKGYTQETADSLDGFLRDEVLFEEDKSFETSGLQAGFGDLSEPPLEILDIVLSNPDFGGNEEGWGIRFKDAQGSTESLFTFDSPSWVERIKQIFAATLRIILIIAIMGMGVFSLLYLHKWKPHKKSVIENPKPYGIAPVLQESPAWFLARSRRFHAQGQSREAWAACLGASIAALSQKGVPLFSGATEYDCLALVREILPDNADGFADLLRQWVALAYAGKFPNEEAFQTSLEFCESLLVQRNNA